MSRNLFLLSIFVTISGISSFSLSVRNRRSGPDGDSGDPIGSSRLRPVFLGIPSGLEERAIDVSMHRTKNKGLTSLDPQEFAAPEGPFESEGSQLSEIEGESESEDLGLNGHEFGLPNSAIRERLRRERLRKQKLRNQIIIHPDSDSLKSNQNKFVVDDPLPEMIAGGDMEANPSADRTSLMSVIQQLFLQSIGLK